ncbi:MULTISPECIES: hypothetical protein [pseudomallei group]|uniref:Phage-related protein n=1 Tax=Burkholderia thailandensis TaxID=57975 RepID=A0AAW9CVE4_BURTH|nr:MULTISPECIES: hypothetical protein [pseudomallei group]UCR75693.1 hypothetical protein BtTXDOH_44 [Burkholderia phage phiBt-TXDOH]AIP65123.1 hypothetical protein DR62_4522 [Burkholderia thailandensis]AOI55524.1 hypothetical protein WI24_27730 [Burkholderia thailandensis]ARK42600.1 hypothetical protein BOC60_20155 [Burkholderia pseudomallei]MCS3393153.1 hypothetical protein [Burkholderia thailandensis]
MKERPILFSGPMVRAILDGRKTQTRRIVKCQPPDDVAPITVARYNPTIIDRHGEQAPGLEIFGAFSDDGEWGCKSPFGEPGDRLWVRETHLNWWKLNEANPDGPREFSHVAAYAADGYELQPGETWIPSIHMLRAASRITLEITGVRVERLQDISEVDAISEGIDKTAAGFWSTYGQCDVDGTYSPRLSYQCLWNSLNAARGFGWDANPWVWVVEFAKSV